MRVNKSDASSDKEPPAAGAEGKRNDQGRLAWSVYMMVNVRAVSSVHRGRQ